MSHAEQLDPAIQPDFITAKQLALKLQISKRTLWRKLSAGDLPSPVRVGGIVRWRLVDVEQWIADGCPPRSKEVENV
jgi:predicted DNA-binding transcriptional regulator AlpA